MESIAGRTEVVVKLAARASDWVADTAISRSRHPNRAKASLSSPADSRAAALVRGSIAVQRLNGKEIRAVPELMVCRSVGSVLWRAGRWRRGQAQARDVVDRIDELVTTLR